MGRTKLVRALIRDLEKRIAESKKRRDYFFDYYYNLNKAYMQKK